MTKYFDTLTRLVETTEKEQKRIAESEVLDEIQRENRMIALLRTVCKKLDIDIGDHNTSVQYDVPDRSAQIHFHGEVSLDKLHALQEIATNIRVSGDASYSYEGHAAILMTVKPGMEDATISEGKAKVVPSKLLRHLRRWDAHHVVPVADEMESRGHDLNDETAAKTVSDDMDFVDRALPNRKPQKPIRGIPGRKPKQK